MNNSQFVISLDFELLWGVFDKVDPKEKEDYFLNTRNTIPEILKLFKTYDIKATWATVGMLFNENWEEWFINMPSSLPDFKNKNLSAYEFGKQNKDSISTRLTFAGDLIDAISEFEDQELATHTYSHYYCLEKGQDLDTFKMDLAKCVELAKKKNITFKSLVFPRNQFNENYLKVCSDLGITSVRSNPSNWYWKNTQKDSLFQKIARTGDAYLGFNDKSYPIEKVKKSGMPLQQPASRLLRPFKDNFSNKLKLNRIKKEISHAAQNNEIYHLWWHPHNFGYNSKENLNDLENILRHVSHYRDKYGMSSSNMEGISNIILKR